ncbi:DUF6318 family protein [Kribbella caucasensis]|uniref:DUF6318 family protein n=1 Tax=Kribbella caucasensis TaxID=2512215 RepID=UPI002103D650|nr:DUF6318 family protein [Kribbella sp. VKM Ac-2527]
MPGPCTPSPDAGHPETTPPSTTSSTPTPKGTTSGTAEATTPPKRPNAAAGSSLAAGEAFLGYYVDLLNYSYTTGDPQPFLAESDKGCLGCQGLADYVRKINAKNGGLQGDYKDQLMDVKEIYRGSSGRLGGSASVKTGTYQERATPGSSPIPQAASTGTMEFTLAASAGNWVMYEMQIDE